MCKIIYTYSNIRNTIYHTHTQIYIVQTQQNNQFHVLDIQTGIGIGCYPLIPTENSIHNQTTELELQPIPFPSWIWNSQSNSIPRLNSYIQTQHEYLLGYRSMHIKLHTNRENPTSGMPLRPTGSAPRHATSN